MTWKTPLASPTSRAADRPIRLHAQEGRRTTVFSHPIAPWQGLGSTECPIPGGRSGLYGHACGSMLDCATVFDAWEESDVEDIKVTETVVILTTEEASASNVIDAAQVEAEAAQVEAEMARVEIDMARADADTARSNADVSRSEGVPNATVARIEEEVAAASAVVDELEADAEAKGIPLTLSGSRYRIYVTSPA